MVLYTEQIPDCLSQNVQKQVVNLDNLSEILGTTIPQHATILVYIVIVSHYFSIYFQPSSTPIGQFGLIQPQYLENAARVDSNAN
jgi:hypothetical protein